MMGVIARTSGMGEGLEASQLTPRGYLSRPLGHGRPMGLADALPPRRRPAWGMAGLGLGGRRASVMRRARGGPKQPPAPKDTEQGCQISKPPSYNHTTQTARACSGVDVWSPSKS